MKSWQHLEKMDTTKYTHDMNDIYFLPVMIKKKMKG